MIMKKFLFPIVSNLLLVLGCAQPSVHVEKPLLTSDQYGGYLDGRPVVISQKNNLVAVSPYGSEGVGYPYTTYLLVVKNTTGLPLVVGPSDVRFFLDSGDSRHPLTPLTVDALLNINFKDAEERKNFVRLNNRLYQYLDFQMNQPKRDTADGQIMTAQLLSQVAEISILENLFAERNLQPGEGQKGVMVLDANHAGFSSNDKTIILVQVGGEEHQFQMIWK
ncbi:hypothetical protein [Microbulbifer guangxiensis]|uniref:hypothetical protein n=1 Tax=Microbulbifer guangxiensis TaxID=2904249 RepID=UPI001F318191|nr:hypothetical protein [Microbulbifer guangxiensis]